MKEPKRYYCGNGEGMFEDDKNGHWVEYSEHKAIVEALTEQLRKHDVIGSFSMQDLMLYYQDAENFDFTSKAIEVLNSMVKTDNIEIKVPVAGYGKPLVLYYDEPVYIADSYPDAVKYVEKNLL